MSVLLGLLRHTVELKELLAEVELPLEVIVGPELPDFLLGDGRTASEFSHRRSELLPSSEALSFGVLTEFGYRVIYLVL